MDTSQIANLFGFIAAGIGIIMFIPQAAQIWKTKNTTSISLITFAMIAAGSVCWIIYAILLYAPPVLLVNSIVLMISLYIVMMKLKYK
jgi:MtN3 and saliva related transmembrane protein